MEIVPVNFDANPGQDSIRATVDSINRTADGSVVIIGNFDFTIANSQQVKVVLKLDYGFQVTIDSFETRRDHMSLFSGAECFTNLEKFCVLESAQTMNAGSYSYPFEIKSKRI